MKAKKLVLAAHFPHVSGFIGPILSKNNKVHPWVDSHRLCKFQENGFKTATCVVRSYT